MFTILLGFLLLVCQIIPNESSVITEDNHAVRRDTSTLTQTPTPTPTPTLPEGYTRFPQVHAAYKVHNVTKRWREGRDVCISEGADLAIADTREKINLISSVGTTQGFNWIATGFYKQDFLSDQWYRIDTNETVNALSLPWIHGAHREHDCTGIAVRRSGLWDYNCFAHEEYFACEIAI